MHNRKLRDLGLSNGKGTKGKCGTVHVLSTHIILPLMKATGGDWGIRCLSCYEFKPHCPPCVRVLHTLGFHSCLLAGSSRRTKRLWKLPGQRSVTAWEDLSSRGFCVWNMDPRTGTPCQETGCFQKDPPIGIRLLALVSFWPWRLSRLLTLLFPTATLHLLFRHSMPSPTSLLPEF